MYEINDDFQEIQYHKQIGEEFLWAICLNSETNVGIVSKVNNLVGSQQYCRKTLKTLVSKQINDHD